MKKYFTSLSLGNMDAGCGVQLALMNVMYALGACSEKVNFGGAQLALVCSDCCGC